MFMHNKKLMYTVRVSDPNPVLATLLLEQFGGPQGELAAAMRYFTQALTDEDPGRKDMLFDIATEEMSHLEIIGTIFCMMNKGLRGKLAEGVEQASDMLAQITRGGDSHTTSILYGGGAALVNSAGLPWRAEYIDTIGEPTADLRSNIAAEARAKIVYERLINATDDPGVKDALGFLMTREVAHQKSFEKALYAIEPNFPPGKQPARPEFANKYYNMSQGNGGDVEGPWNSGEMWEVVSEREQQAAVDGGDGSASVALSAEDKAVLMQAAERTASDPSSDPMTGAELGAGPGAGALTGGNGSR
ncbi:MAG: manganese catalase family protein [Alphaproteobacteria bacterium]|nr:manganese catalase family protein [Alphaproteobacteria bacterium]